MLRADRRVDVVHREVMVRLERLVIRQAAERGLWVIRAGRKGVAEVEDILVEERHLDVRMGIVEIDGGLQSAARHWHTGARGEVRLHVVPKVETEHEELAGASGEVVAERVEVDHRRTDLRALQECYDLFERVQHLWRRCYESGESW